MFIAYILQSENNDHYYYGYTEQNVIRRLAEHNQGKSSYTKKYRPWKIVWYGTFSTKQKAQNFEKYLKTPSGYAFARKRLIEN